MPVTNADGSFGYRQRKGFTTKTAAKEFLDDRLQLLKDKRDPFPEDVTFDDYLPKVLDRRQFVDKKLQAPARSRYEQLARAHISPVIGTLSVQDLSPGHFEAVLEAMGKKGLSVSTIRQSRVLMNMTMRRAVKDGLTSVNPVAEVTVPAEARTADVRVMPTKAQVQSILRSAEATRWALPLLLAARTGARRSELLGLAWGPEGIDLDNGTMRIVRGLHKVSVETDGVRKTETVYLRPKSDRSRRTVKLAADLIDSLRRHKVDQSQRRLLIGERWIDEGLVFDNGDGAACDPDEMTRAFRRFADEAGCDRRITLHSLRHFVASHLLAEGEPATAVSEYLGHHSAAFTLSVYGHGTEGAAERLSERMAGLFA